MASTNPAFSKSPAFSDSTRHEADLGTLGGRLTYEDAIVKTAIAFVVLFIGAAVGWSFTFLMLPAAIIGFVLALFMIFKRKTTSPGLVLMYSALQGVSLGAITSHYELEFPGIAIQALLGTLTVAGVTLALFANGKIRASKKVTKIFLIAMVSYLAFSLINLLLLMTGVLEGEGLRSGPIGIVISILVILMASYSLVLDFDEVQRGVERGVPKAYAWAAAFGLVMTIVWLYLEILRLIGALRR